MKTFPTIDKEDLKYTGINSDILLNIEDESGSVLSSHKVKNAPIFIPGQKFKVDKSFSDFPKNMREKEYIVISCEKVFNADFTQHFKINIFEL